MMKRNLGWALVISKLQLICFQITFQHFENRGPLKDLSIKVAELETLYSELQAITGLDLDKFKETGYYRYKDVGKYLSKNLRDYMFNGLGQPKDEGVVLTLYFDIDANAPGLLDEDDTLSFFLHKDIGDEEKEQVQGYMDKRFGRDKRATNRLLTESVRGG